MAVRNVCTVKGRVGAFLHMSLSDGNRWPNVDIFFLDDVFK
jgi:hypothetical protein